MENEQLRDVTSHSDGFTLDDARRILAGEVYIDLVLDDGFKQVFGNDGGKKLMIGLLNAVLPVYIVAFVDFQLNHSKSWTPKYETEYRLIEHGSGDPMTDKLSFTFVELGRFNKRLEDCEDFKEKLYFCLKNMNSRKEAPDELVKDEYFNSLFEYSALNRLTGEELIEYVKAMTTERDKACQIAYAHDKGVEEGIAQGIAKGEAQGIAKGEAQGIAKGEAQGIAKVAKSMLSNGLPVESIAEMTGLTIEQVLAL